MLLLPLVTRADEATRALQTALKNKGFYDGSPSGAMDTGTHSALRRFQIHEGLPVNGEADAATTQALGIAMTTTVIPGGGAASGDAASPARADSTNEAVRGQSAGEPQESDREALRRALEEPTPADTAGVPRLVIRPTPVPVDAAPRLAPPRDEETITAFVERYLTAGASPDVDAELGQYADLVDYFNNGRVNRQFIRRDSSNYRHRWPQRAYTLEDSPVILRGNPGDATLTVRFRLRYQVRAGTQVASGRTESTMDLVRDADGRFRIVSIKEKTLPRL